MRKLEIVLLWIGGAWSMFVLMTAGRAPYIPSLIAVWIPPILIAATETNRD